MFDFSSSSSRTLRIAVEPYPVLVLPTVSLGISLTITPRILFPFPMKGEENSTSSLWPFLRSDLVPVLLPDIWIFKTTLFFIMVWGRPVIRTSGSPGSAPPAPQSLVTDLSRPNYHFASCLPSPGTGEWRNCYLSSFKSGIQVILIRDGFCLP